MLFIRIYSGRILFQTQIKNSQLKMPRATSSSLLINPKHSMDILEVVIEFRKTQDFFEPNEMIDLLSANLKPITFLVYWGTLKWSETGSADWIIKTFIKFAVFLFVSRIKYRRIKKKQRNNFDWWEVICRLRMQINFILISFVWIFYFLFHQWNPKKQHNNISGYINRKRANNFSRERENLSNVQRRKNSGNSKFSDAGKRDENKIAFGFR